MKNTVKFFSVMLLCFTLFSCKSDDSNSDDKQKSELKVKLVGSWLLKTEDGLGKTGSQPVETKDLKVGPNCEYDQLDFLPSNSINFLSHYIVKDNPDCQSRVVPDAYRYGVLDYRRIVLSNGESRNEFFVDKLDENEMILDRMLTNDEVIARWKADPDYQEERDPKVYRIKVHYQRVE
ncbi:hypothetical protein ACPDHL_09260 [Myroides sp. C15-4]|uniref:hypothetical protein n=1 Tax=Myroides sp. C15-4 TaxID=3400532 RepID=UPI003D2F6382